MKSSLHHTSDPKGVEQVKAKESKYRMSAHPLNQQNIHKHPFMLTLHYSITAKSTSSFVTRCREPLLPSISSLANCEIARKNGVMNCYEKKIVLNRLLNWKLDQNI